MTLFANPLQFFSHSTNKHNVSEGEAGKVITYVESLINREDLVDDLVKKYEEAKTFSTDKRESAYIPIYIGLEAFIIRNKPLIVKQEFTKTSLREAIRKQVDINALTPAFRLLFLPEPEQNALIFEKGAQGLARYVINNIGFPHLKAAVTAFNQGKQQAAAVTENGLNFDKIDISIQTTSLNETKLYFQQLYKALLWEITKSLGAHFAETVITAIFDDIRRTYDYDIISQFLDVLPEGVLENERIRRLGRDELENKIQSRTRELDEARKQLEQKLNLIKQQNEELAKAKQDILISLQEEKRLEEEIVKEKEQVEKKVRERTAELNSAMTNLKVSYQQTEYEKARLIASINNLSLGFAMTNSDDEIIAINQISYQILGYQNKQFSTIQQLHEYVKASVNLLEFYQKCKNEKSLQKTGDIKLGSSFLKFFFTPIMLDNTCIGVVVLLEDISEAKLLERSKDEFFAVASHELRTPLTAIRGYTSLILDNFHEQIKGEPTLVTMISNVHESSIRLIKIVNSFLDASKLEQGKVTFNLQKFALTPLIQSVTDDLTQLAKERNIFLTFDKKELSDVYADQEKLKQIMYNLMGNAVKFTQKGGVTVTMEQSGDHIKVSVKDTGLGVSEEYRKLLFRKFQQAGERILTRDAATGSGMGLYISKLLIEGMNGSITIENTKLGEGSTFAFTIPIAKS